MRYFLTIVLAAMASLFINNVAGDLSAKDTIAEEDHARYDAVMESATDNTYTGYYYNKDSVWIKIYDADTNYEIANEQFKGNGKSVEYLLQVPDITEANLSEDGAMGMTKRADPVCPTPPKKREAALFEPRASRCFQFCGRNYSCRGAESDPRCPSCRYVGGLCRWQLWCIA